MRALPLTLLTLLASPHAAVSAETCPEKMLKTPAGIAMQYAHCGIMAQGRAVDHRKRMFTVSADGQFMAFSSFGKTGSPSADTGSRTFYLFPLRDKPSMSLNEISGNLHLRTASGNVIELSPQGDLLGITGGKLTEDRSISGSNQGGVELRDFDGIVLDTGWSQGRQAIENKAGTSVFRDRSGNRCSVPNSKLFDYPGGKGYNAKLRLTTNGGITAFLRKECPMISLESFTPAKIMGEDLGSSQDPDAGAGR